jgi:hypothetical protein
MEATRFDFKFSYWIFLWFILFFFDFTYYNPFGIFVIAAIINLCAFIYFLFRQYFYKAFLHFIPIFLFKLVPIYLMIQRNQNIIAQQDIEASFALFAIYILYLFLLGKVQTVINSYKTNFLSNKINTPFAFLLHKYVF